ncbi:colicin V synthesis protein [Alsobacter soli]|uniref:Colicin V synthesis protein n=1 Tax=Alsobacter soli TaxID=2109933 RepID=A0A2T1HW28_9HYPH|nr:CvpA family protein [Alsobacter soli]PSC05835.1 colicin V synthesis protein [Alsobacter soli]
MPVTPLDLVVLGVIFISALLAAVRGFTREVLAIGSWIAAAAAAYALHPMVLPYAKEYISNAQLALAAAIAAVFLITLVLVSFVTVKISDLILDSKIGALDRSLGFLFGAARGLLIAVIAFVFFDKLVGDKQQPDWVRNAKVRPVLKDTGDYIVGLLPEDPEGYLQKLRNKNKNLGDPSEPPAAPGAPNQPATPAPAPSAPGATPPAQKRTETNQAPSYKKAQQQGLQQLIETAANPAPTR